MSEVMPAPSRHPEDQIYLAARAIRGLAVVLGYTSEKSEKDGDGPGSLYIEAALDAISHFAWQVEEGMDRLSEARERDREAREAA